VVGRPGEVTEIRTETRVARDASAEDRRVAVAPRPHDELD
jgi:hypothetical protein